MPGSALYACESALVQTLIMHSIWQHLNFPFLGNIRDARICGTIYDLWPTLQRMIPSLFVQNVGLFEKAAYIFRGSDRCGVRGFSNLLPYLGECTEGDRNVLYANHVNLQTISATILFCYSQDVCILKIWPRIIKIYPMWKGKQNRWNFLTNTGVVVVNFGTSK